MRRAVAVLLVGALAIPLSVPQAHAAAAVLAPSPEQLYEQGRTEYRLNNYGKAIELWEQSYALSGNRLLLYNLALAHREQYSVSGKLVDLEQAKRRLDGFIKEAQTDDELSDAQARMVEIDELLTKARAADAQAKQRAAAAAAKAQREERRARKLRLAGVVTMATGGALIVTGAAVGSVFAVRGGQFAADIDNEKGQVRASLVDFPGQNKDVCFSDTNAKHALRHNQLVAANGGAETQASQAELDKMPAGCAPSSDVVNMLANIAQLRANGDKANQLSIVGFAAFGAVGLAAIIAGAVVYSQGKRAPASARAARLRVMPQLGARTGFGLAIGGRF